MIQLNQSTFWVICALGAVFLPWAPSSGSRKWIWAALNVAFLAVLLGPAVWALLSVGVLVSLLLTLIARRWHPVFICFVAGATALLLFVIHKLPTVAEQLGGSATARVLTLIGYSYVMLRLVDAFKDVLEQRSAPPSLPDTVNYLLPFHMLAAGPIQSYSDFVNQPQASGPVGFSRALTAVERITAGLFKKFVIAYVLQKLFLTDFQAGGAYRIVEIQVFFVWLYFDFSAYSDIAVGVGSLLGVATPENFNRPLFARNIIDFWDRWHISLSLFIRRHLFIPLQLAFMRGTNGEWPLWCAVWAVSISFFLCGLWHGLTVGFVIWGIAQASGLVIARVYGHLLRQRLGPKRLKTYMANPWIRVAAVVVTFEFEACTLITLFMR